MKLATMCMAALLTLTTTATAGGQADAQLILPYNPDEVIHLIIDWDDNYVELAPDAQGNVIDWSRPAGQRAENVDLAASAALFQRLTVVEAVPHCPEAVNWQSWDWENMVSIPYTPVDMSLFVMARAYDGQRAQRWYAAFSFIPGNDAYAIAYVQNHNHHYNWFLVDAEVLRAVIAEARGMFYGG